MKIFLDTANIDQIKEVNDLGLLDGVTTNPSLAAMEGKKDFKKMVLEICKVCKGPVSAEVVALDTKGMIKEARIISKWAKNIAVKIPITPDGLKAVKVLAAEGIKTNVTLVFSLPQALMAAHAGATFVSPFVGRLDDIGIDGIELVEDCVSTFEDYGYASEVISASIRGPHHVVRSALAGAHIVTLPYPVIKKMFKHPLTDIGMENFLKDWKKAGLKIPSK